MADADKNAIFQRLAGAPTFHPNSASLFTDWNLQAGDVVSIREESDTYQAPLYNMRMTWTGAPMVEVSSSGNTRREPLPALTRRDYGYSSRIADNKKEIEEIEGTELYVNRDSIVAVSGKFTVDGDVVKLIDGALFQVKKNGVYSTVGTVTEIAAVDGKIETEKGRINTIVGTGLYQHRDHIDLIAGKFTFDDTTGNVKLDSGAHLQVLKDGVYSTVGTVTEIDAVGERVSVVEGTAAIQHSDSIWNVAGKFSVDSNNNVHVINGSALYVGEGSASLAVYKEGDITAGFIVGLINGDSTATITADHVLISANKTLTALAGDVSDISDDVSEIMGSGIWLNRTHIDLIAGKFTYRSSTGNLQLQDGAHLQVYKNGVLATVGTVTEINDLRQDITGSALWTQRDSITGVVGKFSIVNGNLRLSEGAQLQIKENNIWSAVGSVSYIDDQIDTITGSTIWQTRNDITAAVGCMTVDENGKLHIVDGSGLYIDQGQTSLGIWNEGNLTAGVMIKKINGGASGDSEAVIKASKINLEGYVTAASLTTTFFHDKIADISLLNVAAIAATASAQNSYCYLNEFKGNYYKVNISGGGGSTTTNDLCDGVYDLQIVQDGNTYKLQRRTIKSSTWTDVGSFSRATSLSGAWSGGTYTVTASPQDERLPMTIHTRLDGTPAASNFSGESGTYDSGGNFISHGDAARGYLILTANGSNSRVDVNTKSDGTGTNVARISVGSIYEIANPTSDIQIGSYYDYVGSNAEQTIQQQYPGATRISGLVSGFPSSNYGYRKFAVTVHGATKVYYLPFDTR